MVCNIPWEKKYNSDIPYGFQINKKLIIKLCNDHFAIFWNNKLNQVQVITDWLKHFQAL